MSVSKLESLPNEILLDLFEKYINGIDIVNAFAFQLNQRFDTLIMQSRRLRFNFIKCHKDDFRVCIDFLPTYVGKIEELALADLFTPGLIHAFSSLYSSFSMFKNLRKLYLQADANTIEQYLSQEAVLSLSNTVLHTLSLKISSEWSYNSSVDTIRELFYIKTLRKLSIRCVSLDFNWNKLKEDSSNLQYLAIHGIVCHSNDLHRIFQCTPDLRYLDIKLCRNRYYVDLKAYTADFQEFGFDPNLIGKYIRSRENAPEMDTSPRVLLLHTVLFDIPADDKASLDQLDIYFRRMPSLRRLEIKTNTLDTLDQWKELVQTSLLSLTSFIVDVTLEYLNDSNVSNMLRKIQTPFWTENQHFNVIIRKTKRARSTGLPLVTSYDENEEKWHEPTIQWYIGPDRRAEDEPIVFNRISSICLPSKSPIPLQNQYLNNVTHLFLYELNEGLLNAITTHINCSRIQHLEVPLTKKGNLIFSLLESLTNLRSLQIDLSQLHDELYSHRRRYLTIQYLLVWTYHSSFAEKDVAVISRLFPHLEHLAVGGKDLADMSTYQTYLPRLRSLSFDDALYNELCYYGNCIRGSSHNVRKRVNFSFQRKRNWITIWIDQAVLHDSFWEKQSDTGTRGNSNGSSLMKRMVNRLSNLFK